MTLGSEAERARPAARADLDAWGAILAIAMLIHVVGYVASYRHARPAANLAYFAYPVRDDVSYWLFYPEHRLHRMIMPTRAIRHWRDRPPAAWRVDAP